MKDIEEVEDWLFAQQMQKWRTGKTQSYSDFKKEL